MRLGTEPATIVGAGIAGLTMALCLARTGFDVELIERAPRLEPVGAGLQLSPNALRILSDLGLLDRLRRTGVAAKAVTLRSGRTGRRLATVPVLSGDGTPYLSILRSDLQSALLAAVEAHPRIRMAFGQSLAQVAQTAPGSIDLVTADASGTRTARTGRPLVIAADGFRSGIAASLDLAPPVYTGLAAFRMMLDAPSPFGGIEAWLGTRHHAVAYPVAGGAKTNLVAIGPVAIEDTAPRPIDRTELLGRFAGWNTDLLRLFEQAGPIAVWPLFEADRMEAALPDGIVLIGDAAHAMLPFAAQGAAMAIEDAAVLAHAIGSAASMADAVAIFRRERLPRLAKVRARVAFHRFVYHLPPPVSWARNVALALRAESALRRDLAWLYDWTPPGR